MIRAHSSAKNSPIKMAFIIMDYKEGKNLKELGFVKDFDVCPKLCNMMRRLLAVVCPGVTAGSNGAPGEEQASEAPRFRGRLNGLIYGQLQELSVYLIDLANNAKDMR
jgi:hypothetical protein